MRDRACFPSWQLGELHSWMTAKTCVVPASLTQSMFVLNVAYRSVTSVLFSKSMKILVVGRQEDLLGFVNHASRLRSCRNRIVMAGNEERQIMGETGPTTKKSMCRINFYFTTIVMFY